MRVAPTQQRRAHEAEAPLYDFSSMTPVRFEGGCRYDPLELSLLMFDFDNAFLPGTHLDQTREAIEWSLDDRDGEWETAATHSGDIQDGGRSSRQELMVSSLPCSFAAIDLGI